ncbi:hypothetical protein [Haloarchaeobius sp. HME9146]|uniref:hypothetical protein n=1 Tax=Haloarchaeobius sp. HME9146 TaxID=2978732 RepID=UPI0021BEA0B0|nr:hypothetical protein [Haloarchaeobius sp. HME9146]MCT9096311.1 hypothetical protein [Haloarchaeobius sp. HME9146]
MRRRAILGALATSVLAGCNGFGTDSSQTREPFDVAPRSRTETSDQGPQSPAALAREQPTTRKDFGALRSLVALEPESDDRLSLTVGFTGQSSAASPVRLWVGLTNEGSSSRGLRVGDQPPISSLEGVDPDTGARLALRPVPHGDPTEYAVLDGTCWRTTDDFDRPTAQQGATRDLGPGDTLGQEYALVTPAEQPGCLVPGQYRFVVDDFGAFTVSVFDTVEAFEVIESRFAGRVVPDLPLIPATSWYHETRAGDGVYTRPSAELVQLADGTLSLEFVNYAARAFTIHTDGWRLYKLHDGTWRFVAPRELPEAVRSVRPGESHVIQGRLTASPAAVDETSTEGAETFAAGGLGPGVYAVEHGRVDGVDGEESGRLTSMAALVELVGEPAPLVPTAAATATGGEGDELTVRQEGAPDERLVLTRLDGTETEAVLLREQAMQVPTLRDTLSFIHDDETVSRVVLTTSSTQVEWTGRWLALFGLLGQEPSARFTYEGQPYEFERDL